MECIISIELGTNAVRVYAFNLKGKTIGFAKGAYPTFHPDPDYSEQDPEQIFVTMLYVLKNLLSEKINPKGYKVESVCFSSSMHSVLAIDRHGAPLGNVITWADNRGKKEARALRNSTLSAKVYQATGTPIHPMSPLIKIKWLENQDRERFKKTYKFLSVKSYIIHELTGSYVIDYSLASATGLMNIYNKKWEPQSLDYASITVDRLPELVPISCSPGKLQPQYQTSLGLSADTKILTGSSDGCFATLGASVWNEDKATITIEDSAAVRVVGKTVLYDEEQRLFNYVLDDEYYVSGGPSNNGGVAFEWFSKQFW
jgi:gluconokinase